MRACTVSIGKLFHSLTEFIKKFNLYAPILDWDKVNSLIATFVSPVDGVM